MKRKSFKVVAITFLLILPLVLSSCGVLGPILDVIDNFNAGGQTARPTAQPTPHPTLGPEVSSELETIQTGFSGVYAQVLPSVVNIQVTQVVEQGTVPESRDFPFPFPFQLPPDSGGKFRRSGLGSGFVWDKEGHVVTNNHVVENAEEIKVTFYDGTSVAGEVVGADRDSDLAVVKVDHPAGQLHPIQLADSTRIEVGQLVAAIGNPFGLQGSMTVGIVSALGRSLPVNETQLQGSTYTIPDVIQTDAPINPGNSGGVLVNMQGQLVGVPTAIESSSGANAGVGFAIPSIIVQKVVPALIEQGFYEHPWVGIRGTTLNSDMAENMMLDRGQRGALVIDVIPGGPAEKAGLVGSDRVVSIDGQDRRIGGDVIIRIDSQPVQDFEDLTAYLARYTEAGQTVTLTLLRNGQRESIELTLGVRPTGAQTGDVVEEGTRRGNIWLGILGVTMSPEIAGAMNLPAGQSGVLIQQVVAGSPADRAGLRGSFKSIVIAGEQVLVGGDIIVALDGDSIVDLNDLQAAVANHKAGDEVTLRIIRENDQIDVNATLAEKP